MSKAPGAADKEKSRELAGELAAARRRFAELEASAAEKTEALEALRISEARYRSVVENVGIGLTLIENARLYQETQAALEELKATHGRYIRQGWSRYLGESSRDKKKDA